MSNEQLDPNAPVIDRQSMDVDIVCVGFGPAMGGFLTTLSRALSAQNPDGTPAFESKVMPGMPPQVICYERADDIGFGVSGVVTRGRAIRATFPDFDPAQVPMTAPVKGEKLVYLLDPTGASRRSPMFKLGDTMIKAFKAVLPYQDMAFEMPYIPPFMNKHDGYILSIGQFNQWVGSQLMGEGQVQIWPGTPVDAPLFEEGKTVAGVRLVDQGVAKDGSPDAGFMPGMDVHAALTVVGDGPVGSVGQALDAKLGLPPAHHRSEWAVGMKVVVDLPESCTLEPGTVIHTFGYPEPEIFGFMYVYPDRVASLGIFVPSWFDNPVRTSYRYLQHWMMHPYLWKHLEGGTLRSFGAKSLFESGKRGEPYLAGDGFARIGEGSGTTNVLSGSGVDEAWLSGVQLAEGVIELMKAGKPFTKENLEKTYVARRRASWLEEEAKVAEKSRDGFSHGVLAGLFGMGITGFTKGKVAIPGNLKEPHERFPSIEEYYADRIPREEIEQIRKECVAKGQGLHNALMDRAGWPQVPLDGKLLVSHQDALLMGGKVVAAPGYRDHVQFMQTQLCERCQSKVCVEICSGQAITMNPDGGVPLFDREKCLHCGACMWNCSQSGENLKFTSGSGGLHSAEN